MSVYYRKLGTTRVYEHVGEYIKFPHTEISHTIAQLQSLDEEYCIEATLISLIEDYVLMDEEDLGIYLLTTI